MKQVLRQLVNYTSDLSGICSALYELGGLIVMHDASGCNSTYATHDEPRWYDTHSLIYISALEEYDAVLGNDDKFIHDIIECAMDQHPKFIALFGSPIALMTGTDFRGIAHLIEEETGIPTFGFKTSGMHSYVSGARQAFAAIADRFCPPPSSAASVASAPSTVANSPAPAASPSALSAAPAASPSALSVAPVKVNLLGVTPLDFSVVGNVEALHQFLSDNDFEEVSCWAMGNTLEDLMRAGEADVNLVVSSSALDCAKILEQKYGTPYVAGVPIGSAGAAAVASALRDAALRDAAGTSLPGSAPAASQDNTSVSASRILHATSGRPARSLAELPARSPPALTPSPSDTPSSDALSSDALSFDALSFDALSFDALSSDIVIVGEAAFAASLRYALEQHYAMEQGLLDDTSTPEAEPETACASARPDIRIICPVEEPMGVLRATDLLTDEEEDIIPLLRAAKTVIADPLYERVMPKDRRSEPTASESPGSTCTSGHSSTPLFVRFPDEAFSGRMFRSEIPVFIGPSFDAWLEEHFLRQVP